MSYFCGERGGRGMSQVSPGRLKSLENGKGRGSAGWVQAGQGQAAAAAFLLKKASKKGNPRTRPC